MHGLVYNNDEFVGTLCYEHGSYAFRYDEGYLQDPAKPPISLSLPKVAGDHRSPVLFPFFYGLLSEVVDKEAQCRALKIDENDHFSRLLKSAGTDTIGAVTIREAP